eukprot:1597324-Rhodomonas_salina.3
MVAPVTVFPYMLWCVPLLHPPAKAGSILPIALRLRYAMSGTDVGHATLSAAPDTHPSNAIKTQ